MTNLQTYFSDVSAAFSKMPTLPRPDHTLPIPAAAADHWAIIRFKAAPAGKLYRLVDQLIAVYQEERAAAQAATQAAMSVQEAGRLAMMNPLSPNAARLDQEAKAASLAAAAAARVQVNLSYQFNELIMEIDQAARLLELVYSQIDRAAGLQAGLNRLQTDPAKHPETHTFSDITQARKTLDMYRDSAAELLGYDPEGGPPTAV